MKISMSSQCTPVLVRQDTHPLMIQLGDGFPNALIRIWGTCPSDMPTFVRRKG